jgi:RNA recognition motif-containing protein
MTKTQTKTKLVLRNINPKVSEEEFLDHFKKYIKESSINFYYFVSGKNTSICYLNFENVEVLNQFHEEFKDHLFEFKEFKFKISIEFAPYQEVPQTKNMECDGSIEDDKDYLKFKYELENPVIENILSAELQLELKEEEERKLMESNGGKLPDVSNALIDELLKESSIKKKKFKKKKKNWN